MLIIKESYLSSIHDLNQYKKNTISSSDIDEIIEKIKEYDFLIVSTDLNLTKQINEQKEEICSILLDKDKDMGTYFCSAKYCIINNKLTQFNKKKCKKHEYILFCNDYVIKYIEKIENFRQDIYLERDIINTLADKYNFVKKQDVIDFVDEKHFVNLVRKNINGENCKDRFKTINDEDDRYNSIRQTFQQLHILEKEGFIYTDLKLDNILYDFNDNTYNLIDLGSVEKIEDNEIINMNNRTYHRNHFLDLTTRAICFVYNIISHNNYINVTKVKGREKKDVIDVLSSDTFVKKFVDRFVNVESGGCGGYGEFLEFFEEVVSNNKNNKEK